MADGCSYSLPEAHLIPIHLITIAYYYCFSYLLLMLYSKGFVSLWHLGVEKALAFNVHLRGSHAWLCGICRQEGSGFFLQSLIPLQLLSQINQSIWISSFPLMWFVVLPHIYFISFVLFFSIYFFFIFFRWEVTSSLFPRLSPPRDIWCLCVPFSSSFSVVIGCLILFLFHGPLIAVFNWSLCLIDLVSDLNLMSII